VWEGGELLTVGTPSTEDGKELVKVSETDVLNLLKRILKAPTTVSNTKVYVLTSAMKLSARFNASYQQEIKDMIHNYTADLNLELQSRTCEFEKMFQWDNIRAQLLDRMPAPDPKPVAPAGPAVTGKPPRPSKPLPAKATGQTDKDQVTDNGVPSETPNSARNESLINFDVMDNNTTPEATTLSENPMDVLKKIFDSAPVAPSVLTPLPNLIPSNPSTQNGIPTIPPNPTQITFPPFIAHQSGGLTIQFNCVKQPTAPHLTLINALFTNSLPQPMENFVFQSAVPKYMKLQLLPPSSSTIPPLQTGNVTQVIKVANSLHGQRPIVLKLRVEWTQSGQKQLQEATVSNFPTGV